VARKEIPFVHLWERHVSLYFGIFHRALLELEVNEKQKSREDAISEKLCPYLKEQCFMHKDKPQTPSWEAPIPPISINNLSGGKKRKRPDFTSILTDPFALNAEVFEVSLHIECKRLGEKAGTWNLNRNYVTEGIKRFDDEHQYGRNVGNGFMIGYIVSMDPTEIQQEVNKYIQDLHVGSSNLSFEFSAKVVSCNIQFNRKSVQPYNFSLTHLWVDLRN